MLEKKLISLLADGQSHSGEWLGEQLGVSRTAVWKQLKKLEELMVPVESLRGQGYRIPGGLDLLDPAQIRSAIPEELQQSVRHLEVLDETPSTNDWVKQLAGEMGWRGIVCLAERQSSGRGRRGRHWVSPFGRNLYLSLGWEFDGGAALLEGLSLAVGVAACRALGGRESAPGLQLKWPNDIFFDGRKLGGVLVEMQGDPAGLCHLTIGVGINQGMASGLADRIDQPWADTTEFSSLGRNALASALIAELIRVLEIFDREGFGPFHGEWSRYDLAYGHDIALATGATRIIGIGRGIAENGALLIETATGTQRYSGGEVTLRLLA